MSVRRRADVAAALLTGALAAAACTSPGSTGASAPTTPPTSASGSPTGSVGTGQGPSLAPGGNGGGIDRCHTAQLRGQVEVSQEGGAGQRFALLGLTNTGAACRMFGYPGMMARDANQHNMPTDVQREPNPAPVRFVLDPGATAWARLHWTVVPAGDEPGTQCQPNTESLWVTPPDETSQLPAPARLGAICQHNQISVSAMAAGRPAL
jgi:hypothetical protein